MPTRCPIALNHDPCALQTHLDMMTRHVDRTDETKAGAANFVEPDAADPRSGWVLHPAEAKASPSATIKGKSEQVPLAMMDNQRDVVTFLSEPSAYGPTIEKVDIIETHVSLVFLAGDRAYKLKRAVQYPYLDFSTAERRKASCEAELALNRRTAPALYLETRGIFRTSAGRLSFSPPGTALDWVVVMRRLDQALLFDGLAKSGCLSTPLMDELADHIAAFHAAAQPHFDRGGAVEMREIAEIQHQCLTAARRAG